MTADDSVVIGGVQFMSLYHHDGRFVRGGGLFAFARRDPDGGRTIFCLDLAQDISRQADCGHAAWAHAVSNGMNELLVHLAGSQQTPGEVEPGVACPPIRYALFEASVEAIAEPAEAAERAADHAA
jgi:hypothetical protein